LDEVNNHGACSPSNLHDQPSDRPEVGRIGLFSSTFTVSSTAISTSTTTMPHSIDTYLDKNSEAWRRLCEARSIARKPDLTRRIDWLDDIERRRGRDARAELEIEVVLELPDKPTRHQHLAGVELRLGAEYRQGIEAGVHATWRERKAAGRAAIAAQLAADHGAAQVNAKGAAC
jgi:hypothetical protein